MDSVQSMVKKMKNEKLTGTMASDLPPGLASPARRALAVAGIARLEQFAQISEAELLKLHGMGPKAIRTIREAMSQRGLTFASSDESSSVSEQANQRIRRRAPKSGR